MEVVEDTGKWLGVDTSGRQPKLSEVPYNGIGHNSELAVKIQKAEEKYLVAKDAEAKAEEDLVTAQGETEDAAKVCGRVLNEARALYPSNEEFGRFLTDKLSLTKLNQHERAALMWLARDEDSYYVIKEKYPKVKTIRGRHAKWKEEEKAKEDAANNPDNPSDKPNEPKDKKPWNTDNPDTTKAKAKLSTVASSIFGVLTNVQLFEETNGVDINAEELTGAIMSEINIQGERPDSEIQEQINGLKYVLNLLGKSLPVIGGEGTNVINLSKKMHKGNKS